MLELEWASQSSALLCLEEVGYLVLIPQKRYLWEKGQSLVPTRGLEHHSNPVYASWLRLFVSYTLQ